MGRKAVIDLGTNTFHLLIVQMKTDGGFEEIYRERIYVYLTQEGIETIGPTPFKRALEAMIHFREMLTQHHCTTVTAIGTAALRTASNGKEFITAVFEKTNIQIKLIDGLKEADLIYKGVRQAVAFDEEYQLMMDIGGGSVEFIIANEKGVVWAESFKIGVGILFRRFHESDPISEKEIERLKQFLEQKLQPLFPQLQKYRPTVLTGSAGAFETIMDLMPHVQMNEKFAILKMDYFPKLRDYLIYSNLEQKRKDERIPKMRVEMIAVSTILIDFILKKSKIEQAFVSAYALKEGVISPN